MTHPAIPPSSFSSSLSPAGIQFLPHTFFPPRLISYVRRPSCHSIYPPTASGLHFLEDQVTSRDRGIIVPPALDDLWPTMVFFAFFVLCFLASPRVAAGRNASDTLPTVFAQSNTSKDKSQELIGRVGNPKQRRTLALLIECLTTIFACTWTVLHLNLPFPNYTIKT